MKGPTRFSSAALAVALGATLLAPRPALADGAASTRNIIFGAAAATAGTLLIINHNKKVHQKYAEYERHQAQTQSEANQAEAAYESERSAYAHEAALVSEYRSQTAYQHDQVLARDREIASLKHSLVVAKYGSSRTVAHAAPRHRAAIAHAQPRHRTIVAVHRAATPHPRQIAREPVPAAQSLGWGNY